MEQAEEAAAEAEAERDGAFGLEEERGVVEPKLLQRFAQQGVFVGVDRVEAGEDHGLDFFETGQRFDRGAIVIGDGVADLGVGNVLDVGDKEANFAGDQFFDFHRLGREYAQSFDLEHAPVPPQADVLSLLQGAFEHAGQDHHAAIGIEPGIKNQRLQVVARRRLWAAAPFDDGFQNIGYALAGFGADQASVRGIESDGAFDHFLGALDVGARQVDLVDDRNDLKAVVDGEVGVGERLRFDSLGGVNNQQGAFARSQRARNLVGKIHVPGRVDQVELVRLCRPARGTSCGRHEP